ncbi:MAG: hypothetical protein HYY45_12460 [Deltaproteobacteria bacterium]|nr:hypothetical protein [Deltaproteobacteria bacterium]
MDDQFLMTAAKGLMVFLLCWDKQSIPGLLARSQNQDEPAIEITTSAAEHRLLDIGGFL